MHVNEMWDCQCVHSNHGHILLWVVEIMREVLEIVKILMFQTVAIVCKCFLPLNFTK